MRNAECGTRSNDSRVKESESSLRIPYSDFRILPVLDLLNGIVVRGVGGRRDEYRPVKSVLTDSVEPLAVARAFRERLGLSTLYIADLDAILRNEPNHTIYRELAGDGFQLWIDAGLRSMIDANCTLHAGAARIIVGLETLPDLSRLCDFVAHIGSDRLIFSLDLKAGQPLLAMSESSGRQLENPDPLSIARAVFAAGIQHMIVLDLGSVGEQAGPSTLELCRAIQSECPSVRLITGGGVRHFDDLQLVRLSGINGVLLATSLHRGDIRRADLDRIASFPVTEAGISAASTQISDPT